MPNIKTQIGLTRERFALEIISKHSNFPGRGTLVTPGKKNFTLSADLNLVYAFPLMVIKRSTLLLEKIRTFVSKTNRPVQITQYFENIFSLTLSTISSLNKSIMAAFTHLIPEKTLQHIQEITPSQPPEAKRQADRTELLPRTRATPFLDSSSLNVTRLSNVSLPATTLPSPKLLSAEVQKFRTTSSTTTFPEKQTKWSSEKILQHSQYMGLFQTQVGRIQPGEDAEITFRNLSGIEAGLDTATRGKDHAYRYEYALKEHVFRTQPQIIRETKEKIVEKESVPAQQAKPPALDVNRLADQVIQLIERKVRIERERRGL